MAVDEQNHDEDQNSQHGEHAEPDAPDVERPHGGKLNAVAARGEGEVAAHRAAVGLLPTGAVFTGVDAQLLLPVGREIAHGVRVLPVVGKLDAPLLEHFGVGNHRRHFAAAEAGEVALHAVEHSAGLHVERRGRERLGGHGDGVAVVVVALDQDDSLSALSRLFRGKAGGVGLVNSGDDGVKVQIREVGAVPVDVTAALGGRLGDVAFVDGVAVVESAAKHRLVVGDEGEREGLHALGEIGQREKLCIADGLGPSGVALTVDAGEIVGDIVVMLKCARVAAGDRTLVLLAVGDIDERVVPAHGTAAAVDIFLYAGADDAADILLAAERALGKAAVHRCAGETGDAAGIAAVFVRDGAGRRLTRGQIAEVHAADDAADIAALTGHIAGVDALLDDGAVLILLAVDVRKMARDIVLGVERVFNGHGACDAAGIHIAVHRAAVAAGRDFTERDGIDVDIGGVDNDVTRAAAERGNGGKQRSCQLVELVVDRTNIICQCADRAAGGVVEHRDLTAQAVDRRGQPAKIRCSDNLSRAGDGARGIALVARARACGTAAPDGGAVTAVGMLVVDAAGCALAAADQSVGGMGAVAGDDAVNTGVQPDVVQLVGGVIHIAGHAVQARGNLIRAAFGMVGCCVDKTAELVELCFELLQQTVGDLHADIGLHLAGDAADVLSPADRAFIAAREHLSAAAADHAANIVADVLITDGGVVCARRDRAGGIACNTAGVGGGVERVGAGELGEVEREFEVQIAQVDGGVGALDVYIGAAAAGDDGTEVLAHDAAGHALAEDRARGVARAHDARGEVAAHDAADAAFAGNTSVECAAFDRAVVFTHDAADIFAVAGRGDRALNIQVFDDGVLLQHAEKTGGGDALRDGKAADGVAVAVERAAERRDGELVIVGQRDIVVKHNGFTARPGVERAGMREGS